MQTTPQQLVDKFEYINSDKSYLTLPHHIDRAYAQLERHHETDQTLLINDFAQQQRVSEIKSEISRAAGVYSLRRQAERMLADYIEESVVPRITEPTQNSEYLQVASKLRNCRQSGVIGLKPSGEQMCVWDTKCGLVRLCPDESREESQRIATKYIPAITHWMNSGTYRRAYYAVFTVPNYSPGTLKESKKALSQKFANFMRRKCALNIAGAISVQEDPLSAHDDWNVHLNVILLVEGGFDFKEIRREWGHNVDLNKLTGTNVELIKAFKELIKYSSAPILEKSFCKAKDRSSKAPSILNWSPHLFDEWYRAQKGFRRTRSYGILNKQTSEGKELLTKFESDEKLDLDEVLWIATVRLNGNDYEIKHRSLNVDLIQGYNSTRAPAAAGSVHGNSLYDPPPEIPPDIISNQKGNNS